MELELVGTIKEIWHYPVSSMAGEQRPSVNIDKGDISGDRIWCIADGLTGEPAAPEKEARWRPILFLQSRLRVDTPEIGFPDGAWLKGRERRPGRQAVQAFWLRYVGLSL